MQFFMTYEVHYITTFLTDHFHKLLCSVLQKTAQNLMYHNFATMCHQATVFVKNVQKLNGNVAEGQF